MKNFQIYHMECGGKHYIGQHHGDIFKDNYFGCGTYWKDDSWYFSHGKPEKINQYSWLAHIINNSASNIFREVLEETEDHKTASYLEDKHILEYFDLYRDDLLNAKTNQTNSVTGTTVLESSAGKQSKIIRSESKKGQTTKPLILIDTIANEVTYFNQGGEVVEFLNLKNLTIYINTSRLCKDRYLIYHKDFYGGMSDEEKAKASIECQNTKSSIVKEEHYRKQCKRFVIIDTENSEIHNFDRGGEAVEFLKLKSIAAYLNTNKLYKNRYLIYHKDFYDQMMREA